MQKGRMSHWQAQIVRTEGVVDEKNRVTYAVARIEDPYNMRAASVAESALPMGTFVTATIQGTTVENVVRVPRMSLRGNDQLMFIDAENTLQIQTVDVLRADAEYAYLNGATIFGDRIILTAIESPLNGMSVRTSADPVEESTDDLSERQLAVENDDR
jgi:hypothetical protein